VKTKKIITIVLGEPNSVFTEILTKVLNKIQLKKKFNYPIIIVGSKQLLKSQLNFLGRKLSFETIDIENCNFKKLKNQIYLININYNFKNAFEKITFKSRNYINNCFNVGLKLLNSNISKIIINGPVSKKHFLKNKYPGITEYIFDKSKTKISKNPVMLIFNNKLSVSPLTTHIPLKNVNKKINQKTILNNVLQINNFYKSKLKIKPKIAILGLNPHCESYSKKNEDKTIIEPAIKKLKKYKINIKGPFPADTFFLKKNVTHFDTVVGMYHDQVLTPFKTIFEFDASNITLGMPFLRFSVDHGPNESMLGKNKSNTKSIENIFNFINSLK
tara:strand:+ start:544 stop:1533 length:990 start_codon:yes stop_codon:yes gene_type:complete